MRPFFLGCLASLETANFARTAFETTLVKELVGVMGIGPLTPEIGFIYRLIDAQAYKDIISC